MSTSITYNTNVAGGCMNVVSGPQHNTSLGPQNVTNITGAILVLPAESGSSKPIGSAEPSLFSRFSSVVGHISSYCSTVQDIQNEYPRINLLAHVSNEMRAFASIVAFIGAALDIIETDPGRLDRLSYFQSTERLLYDCAQPLCRLKDAVPKCKQLVTSPPKDNPRREILLCILAHYFARKTLRRLGEFLRSRADHLSNFVDILASKNWFAILEPIPANRLKSLLERTGVCPVARICHIQLSSFSVRDHLGRCIPVPLGLCLSRADFGIIIKYHCRDVLGSEFIHRDEWAVVKRSNKAVLEDDGEFIKLLNDAETLLDISLILEMMEDAHFA